MFFTCKSTLVEQFQGISEEKMKEKSKLSVFFLVGPDSSISEDSATIEYSASVLNRKVDLESFLMVSQWLVTVLHNHTNRKKVRKHIFGFYLEMSKLTV